VGSEVKVNEIIVKQLFHRKKEIGDIIRGERWRDLIKPDQN
jgi:hypothetical protein